MGGGGGGGGGVGGVGGGIRMSLGLDWSKNQSEPE